MKKLLDLIRSLDREEDNTQNYKQKIVRTGLNLISWKNIKEIHCITYWTRNEEVILFNLMMVVKYISGRRLESIGENREV